MSLKDHREILVHDLSYEMKLLKTHTTFASDLLWHLPGQLTLKVYPKVFVFQRLSRILSMTPFT